MNTLLEPRTITPQLVRSPTRAAGLPLMKTLLEPSTTPPPEVASPARAAGRSPDCTSVLPCTTTPGAGASDCAKEVLAIARASPRVNRAVRGIMGRLPGLRYKIVALVGESKTRGDLIA